MACSSLITSGLVKPTLYWVKKIPPDRWYLLAHAWVNSSRKDMDMVRCDFRCADPLESVDISLTSLWSLAVARARACCNFAKTKTVSLVLFYLQIVCLEGSVEVYVDTFPLFCFVLLSQFSRYEGKAWPSSDEGWRPCVSWYHFQMPARLGGAGATEQGLGLVVFSSRCDASCWFLHMFCWPYPNMAGRVHSSLSSSAHPR